MGAEPAGFLSPCRGGSCRLKGLQTSVDVTQKTTEGGKTACSCLAPPSPEPGSRGGRAPASAGTDGPTDGRLCPWPPARPLLASCWPWGCGVSMLEALRGGGCQGRARGGPSPATPCRSLKSHGEPPLLLGMFWGAQPCALGHRSSRVSSSVPGVPCVHPCFWGP